MLENPYITIRKYQKLEMPKSCYINHEAIDQISFRVEISVEKSHSFSRTSSTECPWVVAVENGQIPCDS